MSGLSQHYSAVGIETRILQALQDAGFDLTSGISPIELGALDHFHTGGLSASQALQRLAAITPSDRVLDIGAGLAGPARMLAHLPGCQVDCIELSFDYCAGAMLLNRLTGLQDKVLVCQGSALDMPYDDNSFDVAWMQNVGMNIQDKLGLYTEIHRVLKPGGRFAFQEMAAGSGELTNFPLPWASDPADNCLVSMDAMGQLLESCGFHAEVFEDTSEAHLRSGAAAASSRLSLAVFVDNLGEKAGNARRALEQGQIRLVRGVFRRAAH